MTSRNSLLKGQESELFQIIYLGTSAIKQDLLK